MSKDDNIHSEAIVIEKYGGGMMKVELLNGMKIMASRNSNMRKRKIRVVVGDRIKLYISPYDLSKGVIYWRFKD